MIKHTLNYLWLRWVYSWISWQVCWNLGCASLVPSRALVRILGKGTAALPGMKQMERTVFMPALQGHQGHARLDIHIGENLLKFPLLERRPHCIKSYSVLHQCMLSRRNSAEPQNIVNDLGTKQRAGMALSCNTWSHTPTTKSFKTSGLYFILPKHFTTRKKKGWKMLVLSLGFVPFY